MQKVGRHALPHTPPFWIDSENAVFFITICTQDRRNSPLLDGDTAEELLKSIRYYHANRKWWIHVVVIMPDHLHLLARFPSSMSKTVASWKEWTAKNVKVEWQRDFIDHRLRSDESLREKADYILMNPVRAGLVEDWQFWPHHWVGE